MKGVRQQREKSLLILKELRTLSDMELIYLTKHFDKVARNYTGTGYYSLKAKANKCFKVLEERNFTFIDVKETSIINQEDFLHLDKYIYR